MSVLNQLQTDAETIRITDVSDKPAAIYRPSQIAARELYEMALEVFVMYGTEISTNPDPRKVEMMSDEWISDNYIKDIRRSIQKYINKRYADIPLRERPVYGIKMLVIWEHSPSGKYHNHGIFYGMPNDMVDLVNKSLSKHFGRTEIQMVKHQKKYIDYMFKSYLYDLADRDLNHVEDFDNYDFNTIGLKL